MYDDYTLPPLCETLDELTARFADRRFLTAVDGERIVGSVRAFQEGETCFLERLIVHPDYRRQGIGTDLLRRVEAAFPDARRFELFTGHKSASNIRLYERLGYRQFRQEPVSEKVTLVFLEKMACQLAIRSERLELIAATKELLRAEDDLAQLAQALQADVPDNWPTPLYDRDARQHFLDIVSDDPEAIGWTAWYILLCTQPARKTLIGAVGACGVPDEAGCIVIGYSLLDQFHGNGYATEALRGFLAWATRDLRLRQVMADTFPHLTASIRVLEKSRFVRSGTGNEEGTIRFELAVR